MKNKVIILLLLVQKIFSQVGVGTTNPQSILDIQSNGSGLLIPRLLKSDRDKITPSTSEIIYQIDETSGFYYFDGSTWLRISDSNSSSGRTGNSVFKYNTNLNGIEPNKGNNTSSGQYSFSTGENNNLNADYSVSFGKTNNISAGHYTITSGEKIRLTITQRILPCLDTII